MKISDRDMKRAALIQAAGYDVGITKTCSPRCIAEYPDLPAVRQLLDLYETGKVLPIPHRDVMAAFSRIMAICKELKQGVM